MRMVLDTHAVLWAVHESERLGAEARQVLRTARRDDMLLSDISLLEISMLSAKGRIHCVDGVLLTLRSIEEKVRVIPIGATIATRAMSLPLSQGDPFDRVIVATAMELKVPLCTRDGAITESALVPVVW